MKKVINFLFLIWISNLMAQTDYWYYQVYFSGCQNNHIPKGMTLPGQDKKTRAILNAIIDDNSLDQLKHRYPASRTLILNFFYLSGFVREIIDDA